MSSMMQKSFAGGEIAPALYSRTDVSKYGTSLRTCRNFLVMRHGGAQNRPGTQYVGGVKDHTKTVRLIPFIFSQSQTYVLEFGNLYMRVIHDGAYLGAPYEIVTPYLEADLPYIKFVQSADVVIVTHPNYQPRKLSRLADTNWTLTTFTFEPEINYPLVLTVTQVGTTGSTKMRYAVTAFDPKAGVETSAKEWPITSATWGETTTSVVQGSLNSTNYNKITWTLSSTYSQTMTELEFIIYKETNDGWAYLGTAIGTNEYHDIGTTPDESDTIAHVLEKFNVVNEYPSTCTFYQQRLVLASSNNDPDKIFCSRTNSFFDFSVAKPLKDDDSINFKIAGKQVNRVNHLVDLGALLIFTESGEFVANGDGAGTLTPTAINLRQSSYNGSNTRLAPVVIGNSAVYVQARGNNVRDINFQFESDNYSGNELSIYSSHMFDKYTLLDWAYQQIPQSILWVVRSDGVLLGLTYVKEQQMLAWHRHDFDGEVENVCTVPEGNEDALYLVIKRNINGQTKRYVERMTSRKLIDIKDAKFLDCFLMYDGRNTATAKTMTVTSFSGGWDYTDTLTLTCSQTYFVAGDVGNEIHVQSTDGSVVRVKIDTYISGTVIRGRPNKTVPTILRNVATAEWTRAVDQISGLSHLEGKSVSVFADGYVVANPNNPAYNVVTVTSGSITLQECYGVISVGLPYTSDIETLNIDSAGADTIIDRAKLVSKVTLFVEESRGIWAGTRPPDEDVAFLDGLTELKIRDQHDGYDSPVELRSEPVDIITEGTWNNNGRVFIRQTDPVPLTILSITPSGMLPFGQMG